MEELVNKKCIPCRGGLPPLDKKRQQELISSLRGWEIVADHHLAKQFSFPDFASALAWVNTIGEIAESEGHHPDILLRWGSVQLKIWTHKIDNLTESDFILAAKIEQSYPSVAMQ
jgi:4a-hydroxytetrahydrobiopterin dehydratase